MSSNELSDSVLHVDEENIKKVCEDWKQNNKSIDISSEDISSVFSPLIECGIATKMISSLSSTFSELETFVNEEICNIIINAAEEQVNVDEEMASQNDDQGSNTKYYTDAESQYTYRPTGSSSVSNSTDNVKKIKDISINISEDVYKVFDDMGYEDSIKLIDFLSTFVTKDKSISDFLTDLNNNEIFKSSILKVNFSDSFKKNIEGIDSDELLAAIYYYYTEKSSLSDITKDSLLNRMLTFDITANTESKEVLTKIITESNSTDDFLQETLKSDNFCEKLLAKYKQNDDTLFNSIMNDICKNINSSTSVDSLLTNSSNNNAIKEKIQSIVKDLNIVKFCGYDKLDNCEALFSNLINI